MLKLTFSDSGVVDGQLAIYVRSVDFQQQFYTIRGKWRVAHPKDIDLISSGRATPKMLAPVIPYFPPSKVVRGPLPQIAMEGGVPRELGAPLVETMTHFDMTAQELYREHSNALDNIYSILADEKRTTILTLDEIASIILKHEPASLTDPERYAVHKSILRHGFYIVPNQSSPVAESYSIRPKWHKGVVDAVIEWVREYQSNQQNQAVGRTKASLDKHPVEAFLRKARQVVRRSRQSRSPTMVFALGPTAKKFSPKETSDGMAYSKTEVESFTETDQVILDYMRLWVQPPLLMKLGMLRTAGSLILRNIGMYDQLPLIPATGYLFLQELGVYAPWENLHVQKQELSLLEEEQFGTDEAGEIDRTKLTDTMEIFRKDWGDLPVFCVDSVHAAEIDDGFSLEPIQGSEEESWIHIHVANPSAFISPDNKIAERASQALRSIYTPERVYPMLPPKTTQELFSLAPNRPTLTFSARMNAEGHILETVIRSGIVRNVLYITPDTVRKFFGVDSHFLPPLTLTVGGEMRVPEPRKIEDRIQDEHRPLFHKMQTILAARRKFLDENKGTLHLKSLNPSEPRVYGGKEKVTSYSHSNSNGYHYLGDPIIQLSGQIIDPLHSIDTTKQDLVAHMMQLAGEIAGKWCKDRNIPLIFSGTMNHPEYPEITKEDLINAQDSSFTLSLPRSFTSSKPVPHASLGLDQYAKCTSPLRRYSDLLAHWQIEAVLRQEAKKELASTESMQNDGILPFSRSEIDRIIARSGWQNMLIDRAEVRSRDFWTCQLLFRAFYFNETQLPKTFQCIIVDQVGDRGSPLIQPGLKQYVGNVLPFGLRTFVALDNDTAPVQRGDIVDVELSYIDVYYLTIITRMVRLVDRPPKAALAGFV